jgi:hypothetical protein
MKHYDESEILTIVINKEEDHPFTIYPTKEQVKELGNPQSIKNDDHGSPV